MSYVSPELRPKFETLSIELKDMILERNVELNTIHDLIRVLEEIGGRVRGLIPGSATKIIYKIFNVYYSFASLSYL